MPYSVGDRVVTMARRLPEARSTRFSRQSPNKSALSVGVLLLPVDVRPVARYEEVAKVRSSTVLMVALLAAIAVRPPPNQVAYWPLLTLRLPFRSSPVIMLLAPFCEYPCAPGQRLEKLPATAPSASVPAYTLKIIEFSWTILPWSFSRLPFIGSWASGPGIQPDCLPVRMSSNRFSSLPDHMRCLLYTSDAADE